MYTQLCAWKELIKENLTDEINTTGKALALASFWQGKREEKQAMNKDKTKEKRLGLYCPSCGNCIDLPTDTTCFAKQDLFKLEESASISFEHFLNQKLICATCGSSDVEKELFMHEDQDL